MVQDQTVDFYEKNDHLQVQYHYLEKANIAMQVFAIFVPPSIPSSERFYYALKMIDVFYERVVKKDKLHPIFTVKDIEGLFQHPSHSRGGMLSLEGADALQGDITNLRTLHRLGLRALGFTWNHRNEAADGVEEPNPGGLSQFGRQLLKEANRLGILLDVSHLSEKGFWDVIEGSKAPILASHSNCKGIHNHKRNLTDEQIKAIFKQGGVIGLTFVPYFIKDGEKIKIKDLFQHLDHLLSLGGENHIAFGSDFDGISQTMVDLQNTGDYYLLVNELLKCYKDENVEKWLNMNWRRLFSQVLG